MKKVLLFSTFFYVTFAVQAQTFEYNGYFVNPEASLLGNFSISIDLKELSFKDFNGLKIISKIKISAKFSPNQSEPQFFDFQGETLFSPNDNNSPLSFVGVDKSEQFAYGLDITPEKVTFGVQKNEAGSETSRYIMNKKDFDYDTLLKAIKSKTSSR